MNNPILHQDETKRPLKPTPIQIKLPHALKYKDGLVLCKEGNKEKVLEIIYDSGLGAIFEVEEVKKQLKPSFLNQFDMLLVYDSIKLS